VGRTLTAPEEAVLVGDHGLICDQVLFATTRSRADLAVVQVVEWVFVVISAQGIPGSYGETRRQTTCDSNMVMAAGARDCDPAPGNR